MIGENRTNGQSIEQIAQGMLGKCRACKPLSMLECVSSCSIWKQKNEFRELGERMRDAGFIVRVINILKSKRRIQILETLSRGGCTIDRLQQEMRKMGYLHSLRTIAEEYLGPLLDARLVAGNQNFFRATLLGRKLCELSRDKSDADFGMPPNSECYEERLLGILTSCPKTFEELKTTIPLRSLPRVLGRLRKRGLVDTERDRDSVFFFRTRRDVEKEILSPTEKKVHGNISEEGISARRLADKSMISLRRTYKYLRRLKGKKLVFAKEKSRSYYLTSEGTKLSKRLQSIVNLILEVQSAAKIFTEGDAAIPLEHQVRYEENQPSQVPLTKEK